MIYMFTSRRLGAAAVVAMVASLFGTSVQAVDLNGFLRERGHGDVAVSFTAEDRKSVV